MTDRPFRFIASLSDAVDARILAERARRAESIGYSGLVIPDHLLEQAAPITQLAGIAAVTGQLRVGTFVFNNDLRHPAVLAQELASLDVLSGGRVDIGIGAGWNRPEYDAIGLPFAAVGSRVSRLGEAITVMKGLFAEGPCSFTGEHYTLVEMDGLPKPVQRPHPPFLIGGGGRRLLELAAREAQIIGLAPRILSTTGRGDPRSITLAATEEKLGWVRAAAGDRFASLELNIYPSMSPIVVTDHPAVEAEALASRIHGRTGFSLDPDDLLASPHIFVGSLDGLAQKLRDLRAAYGISHVMLGELGQLDGVVERLAGT